MINFLKYTWVYALISLVVISGGVYTMVRYDMTYSIDFKGGSVLEYRISPEVSENKIKQVLEKQNIVVSEVRQSGSETYVIKADPIDEKQEEKVRSSLKKDLGIKTLTPLRFETVGPSLGKETIRKTLGAALVAIVGILLYMTFTFKRFAHGLAAVTAMAHDFLVLIGVYAVLGRVFGAEVDTLFVTAVLTTMSFSVHDTIVVFDKIREYQRTSSESIDILANRALTETMVRSVNNSLTIVLMLVPLTLFAGDSIRFFAAALLVGTITGTYSSPFIATPLLVFLEKKR